MAFLALRYGMKLADLGESLPYLIGAGTLMTTSLLGGLMIREPPIQKPQTEPFRPWSALKVGWRDRRMILLMLAVPMLNAPLLMYSGWIWLFAQNSLHLSRTQMGASLSWAGLLATAVAFPTAWLIDRVSPYRLVAVCVILETLLCGALLWVHDAAGLVAVSFLFVAPASLSNTANLIIWRAMAPEEVGSVTSAAAFVNNAFNATLLFASGQLIEGLGHNYRAAYLFGLAISLGGFCLLLRYRHLMRRPENMILPVEKIEVPG